MRNINSTNTWDDIAQQWTEHIESDTYRNELLMPLTLSMVGSVAQKTVLDLGCGEGGYSRRLAEDGAWVVAVDISPRLIEIAMSKAKAENLQIEFLVRDASKLYGLENQSFEIVLAAMVLMHVADYPSAIKEIHRVLKPYGRLVLSILHPCFRMKEGQWIIDEADNRKHYTVDNYFGRETWHERISGEMDPVLYRHRPLQDFINPLIAQGFALVKFLEPEPTSAQVEKFPHFARLNRIPRFLIMEWKKT